MSKKTNVKNIYALSPMQEGMLFHAVMDEQSSAYVEQTVIVLSGTVDPFLFEKTLQQLVNRYDILRTVFAHKTTKRPRQVVLKEQEVDFYFQDLSHMDGGSGKADVETFCLQDRQKGFDLTRGPLMRVGLFKVSWSTWYLVWTFHHILMDGWCLSILFKDFMRLYYSQQGGSPITLEPVIPYSRYIQWLEKQDRQKGLHYWQSYLEGCGPPAVLPKLRRSLENNRYQGGEFWFMLEEALTRRLQQLARDNQATENTIFQTLWAILLQRYNDSGDVVFGAVVSGRPAELQGADTMVGLFINTVPVRIKTEAGESFSLLLKKVQLHTLRSTSYEYVPLADIQAFSSLQNQPLDHIIAFENYPMSKNVRDAGNQGKGSSGLIVEKAEMHEQTNYNLNLVASPGKRLGIKFIFNRSVYDEEFLGRAVRQLHEIARQAADNPEIEVNAIDILSEEEKKQVLFDFNKTAADFPGDKTLPGLFMEHVERIPDHIAVKGAHELHELHEISLSYSELNERSNRLAHVLCQKGVGPDTIVGLMVERSIEMIIGILGILKAGGAYLPIDLDYPDERIDYMLKDSNARILLKKSEIRNCAESKFETNPNDQNSNDQNKLSPSNLAYIIYTSGTTGKPKGVMTTHRNAVRVVKGTNYIEITPKDRIMQISNYAFDGSIFDIFGALLNGAVLVLMAGEGVSALDRLSDQLKREQVTVFFVTTALFNALVDLDIRCLQDIRSVLYGGERISIPHAQRALDYLGPGRIFHVYGPTETTVYASYYPIDSIDDTRVTIPIGKPIANTTAYILSKNLEPVPMGAAGELYIGGEGTARGYLNRPELTADKFIFSSYNGSYRSYSLYFSKKLYKTGDLVRMLPDGNIEFMGRVDRQVKIRGFRVEPGEIEHHLLKHEKVKEVCIAVGDNGDKYLCAYVVPVKAKIEVSELREYLAGELPGHMIPAYFVMMEKLPLNPSGKVDTGALPKPQAGTGGEVFTAPRGPVETAIAKFWSVILGIPEGSISINADFFDLGGHSLRAMTMVSKLHKETGVKIPLQEVFTSPTIRELAAYIENQKTSNAESGTSYQAIELAEKREYYPLSSAQKRLFIFQQMAPQSTGYNIPSVMELEGEIDKSKFERVFSRLIQRHESLRTSFVLVKGEPVQQVHDARGITFKIEYYEVESGNSIESYIENVVKNFVRSFNLSRAPLMRVGLVKAANRGHILLLDLHHIITDGVSMNLLFRDFLALYLERTLPVLSLQFKDYSQWFNSGSVRGGEEYRRQESFWLKHLEAMPRVTGLPTDFKRPSQQSFEGDHLNFEIGAKESKALKEMASEADGTLFMVLQAICFVWLSKLSGQEDIVLGIPIEGRNHPDLHHIIGMFVNTMAIRSQPRRNKTFREFLNEVKEGTLQAFENQDYQFEDLVNTLSFTPDPGRNPIIDVMFILQNVEADAAYIQGIEKEASAQKTRLSMKPYPYKNPVSKFDMILTAKELPGGDNINENIKPVYMMVEYATSLFKEESIERFVKYFLEIVRAVTDDKNIRLEDIAVSHGLKQVESYNPEMDLGF